MSSLRPLSWVRGADVRFGKACGNRGPILIFPVNSQHDSRPITIRRGRFPSAVTADLPVLHTRSTSNGSDIGNCGPGQPSRSRVTSDRLIRAGQLLYSTHRLNI